MRQSEFNANQQLTLNPATVAAMRRASAYQRMRTSGFNHVGKTFTHPAPVRAKPIPLQSSVDACAKGLLSVAGLAFTLAVLLAIFG